MIMSRSWAFQAAAHSLASFQASSFVAIVPPVGPGPCCRTSHSLRHYHPSSHQSPMGTPRAEFPSCPPTHCSLRTTHCLSLLFHTFPQPYQTNYSPPTPFYLATSATLIRIRA